MFNLHISLDELFLCLTSSNWISPVFRSKAGTDFGGDVTYRNSEKRKGNTTRASDKKDFSRANMLRFIYMLDEVFT